MWFPPAGLNGVGVIRLSNTKQWPEDLCLRGGDDVQSIIPYKRELALRMRPIIWNLVIVALLLVLGQEFRRDVQWYRMAG